MDTLLTGLIIALAIIILARRLYRLSRGASSSCACGDCRGCPSQGQTQPCSPPILPRHGSNRS